MNRRGFLGALIAAPVVAYIAPKELLSTVAPTNGAALIEVRNVTSLATLTSGQMRLWSAALWSSTRDYGHITQYAAEFAVDREIVADGVELVLEDGTVIHKKFGSPRHLMPDDSFRVGFETYKRKEYSP